MAGNGQNLSSDSIFHFLRQRDWLMTILKEQAFQAFYVYEELPHISFHQGIPMKCFCDIPLGAIKEHMKSYGRYGIGISKTYARANGFSPVIYTHEQSDTMRRYLSSLKPGQMKENVYSLLPYFKPDEVPNPRYNKKKPGQTEESIRYYDEREWRWIPNNPNFEGFNGFSEEELRKELLNHINSKLLKDRDRYKLALDYKDITYLFVEFEKDVPKLIEAIRQSPIATTGADLLISKIITSRQIERDF